MRSEPETSDRRGVRWLPIAGLGGLMGAAFLLGWHEHLSLKTVGLNYDALTAFVGRHLPLALALYVLIYVGVVALSLPGGLAMTLAGGLLFGWVIGALATLIGATVGATIVFLVAKTSLGEPLAARAGPWLEKLRAGFKENALSYLLFLRLVPAFPFFVVNLAPALLGVPLKTYVVGTMIGIVPGTLAFSVAGAGLGSVVETQNQIYKACAATQPAGHAAACPYTIDVSMLVTTELLVALGLLGLVALFPVVYKIWSKHNAAA